jgi:hypothetical protein
VSENGLHHSWTKDHLLSLHAIPFASLATLSVIRQEMHPRIENNTPIYDAVVDDVLALKPVPKELVDKLRTATSLTCLECDWWAWTISDLKVVLENCPNLEVRGFSRTVHWITSQFALNKHRSSRSAWMPRSRK